MKPKIVIVGAGIFGITTAIKLAENGYSVKIFEKNRNIFSAASGINQYRLHRGYHYPRGPDTAQSCKENVGDFYNEYDSSVIYNTEQHYCISRRDSFVTAEEYIDFCGKIGLNYREQYPIFLRENSVDICIKVDEHLFDLKKLIYLIKKKIAKLPIKIEFGIQAEEKHLAKYDYSIIATYTYNNHFLSDFPERERKYQFELCEKPVARLPIQYRGKGIVVMDGPFLCFDPYGNTGLHVMGHVEHAIHQTNIGLEPAPLENDNFKTLLNNGIVENPSITNFPLFINAATEFFDGIEKAEHVGSMFTYRTVLPFMDDTDERPTIVEKVADDRILLFSGKIPTCIDAAKQVVQLISVDN